MANSQQSLRDLIAKQDRVIHSTQARCRSLLNCYDQAQKACIQKEEQIQDERRQHQATLGRRELEIKSLEREVESYYFLRNWISDRWQDDKSAFMHRFTENHSIEAKKPVIENSKHKVDFAKKDYELSRPSDQRAIEVNMEAMELDGGRTVSKPSVAAKKPQMRLRSLI